MIYRDVTKEQLIRIVTEAVKKELESAMQVPTGISVRHIHLEEAHVERLFGPGHRLVEKKRLSQPGQYACEETLDVTGPKGTISRVRVLGPVRKQSQVEVAFSDARALGVNPPVRASGDLTGTPGITLTGPYGKVELTEGVIIADRHIHMTPEDAARFSVADGDLVRVQTGGVKGGIMDQVRIRVSDSYALDFHIDTDDGNAFLLTQGQPVTLIKQQ